MHILIYDYYVFLMNLLFNHYKMPMSIFDILFALKFTFSVINRTPPVFLCLLFILYIFVHLFLICVSSY